ncbi:MAG: ATP-binding protein [Sphingomonadaceae bacterium]
MAEGVGVAQGPRGHSIDILIPTNVSRARRMARAVAAEVGFGEVAIEEIVIAASEMATNLVRHASSCVLDVIPLNDPPGIELASYDTGPGISCLDRALSDGFSTSGGLGYGLGAVNRLMDELHLSAQTESGRGLQVVARKWVRQSSRAVTRCPLAFGIATRAICPG